MRIYILGSSSFMKRMVEVTDLLVGMGVDAFIHNDYRELVEGKREEQLRRFNNGEEAQIKIEYDYLRSHYKHILECDAVLFVNDTKNGIENYIGGNVLIEMGQAYVNNKRIFFLNGMPTDPRLTYLDEIVAMQPICLNGDLGQLKNY